MKIVHMHTLVFWVVILFNSSGHSQTLDWVNQTGGAGYEGFTSIVSDDQYVYVVGSFQGTVDFDPGPGVYDMTATDVYNVFIQKLDLNGVLIWVKQINALQTDTGNSVAVDDMGNVFITGIFLNSQDFNPGPGVHMMTSEGNEDIFLLKLDSNGDFMWSRSAGGDYLDQGYAVTVDNTGDIYVTGSFLFSANFNTNANPVIKTTNGYYDVFIQKVDTDGNLLWVESFGGVDTDFGFSITTDNQNNVYTTGFFWGAADFDPNGNSIILDAGAEYDTFIQKLDADGNFQWVRQLRSIGTGTSINQATSIKTDPFGNVYVTGNFLRND